MIVSHYHAIAPGESGDPFDELIVTVPDHGRDGLSVWTGTSEWSESESETQ